MFTGIIETTARVLLGSKAGLTVERPKIFDDLAVGSSIAVSGVCLSVTAFDDASMTFDVVETTLSKTTLGSLKKGDRVNLERALRADGRLEGHFVLGHVEGTASVKSVGEKLIVTLPKELQRFVIHHGSITLDGVALTVADVQGADVTVALIPHTKEHTTLGSVKPGDRVNVETDILGKYILAHGR